MEIEFNSEEITNKTGYTFNELFDIDEVQKLQDLFSAATGVASIITERDGTPITKPSGFCSLCNEVIRKTEKGLENCQISDAIIGSPQAHVPKIQRCLSSGLMDAGVSIIVEGQHLANWLIGQIIYDDCNLEDLLFYADEIGVEREVYLRELSKVKRMSKLQFENICNYLYLNAQTLSEYAVKNISLAREIKQRIVHESEVKKINSELNLTNTMLKEEIEERQKAENDVNILNNALEGKVLLRTSQLKEKNEILNKSNTLFSAILESSPQVIIFALNSHYCYLSFNNKHKDTIRQIWGKEIKIGMNMLDVIGRHEDRLKAKANFDKALAGESFTLTEEYGDELLSRLFWQNFYSPIVSKDGKVIGLTCFVLDITDRVQAEVSLKEKELLLSESQRVAHIGSYVSDLKMGTWKISTELYEIFGIDESYPHTDEGWLAIIHPDMRTEVEENILMVKAKRLRFNYEYRIIRIKDGQERWVHGLGELQCDDQMNLSRLIGTIQDITDRKNAEKEIIYLSYHDRLTGLYNRRFYEEEIKRLDTKRNLPISIIIGDVNGLKLVNDAFGHDKGDELLQKAAAAIQSACRTDDIVARWGGDEFVILLPKTKNEEVEDIIKRIKEQYSNEHVNALDVSISFGWDTKVNPNEDILKVLKRAEDYMYNYKIIENEAMRGNAIKTIIHTLHEKNPREEQHSMRVSELCQKIGKAMGLPEIEVSKLKVVGLIHDIGKIAIEEGILNKPGKLTAQEWNEIKRHPEIGYRILSSSYEMLELAEGILAHHEKWNGTGYPKGLKGDVIPRISRIIAVADTYDAMTSERSYRKALSEEEAIAEIRQNIGTQFDPEIGRIFVEKVFGN